MNPLRIGIIGASGYIGGHLRAAAAVSGHSVTGFSRTERAGFRLLVPGRPPDFSGLDAVVNLAGESILGFWTPSKKRAIFDSRIESTKWVVSGLGAPRVLINASAIGYYGETGEQEVTESFPPGNGFLADTCRAWEAATDPATQSGVRVVRLRIGFVLGPGGAMSLLRPLFRAGLGGNLGDGHQWMSCVHVDDVAGMILWALENEKISGAVNAVMASPVRNRDFTSTLAGVLHRPAIFPAPAFALRLVLGELSRVMLDSLRVLPSVAVENGYLFRFHTLSETLQPPGRLKS